MQQKQCFYRLLPRLAVKDAESINICFLIPDVLPGMSCASKLPSKCWTDLSTADPLLRASRALSE